MALRKMPTNVEHGQAQPTPSMKTTRDWNLKRLNTISLSISALLFSLAPAFFGLRGLVPVSVRNNFFEFMVHHPGVSESVTYAAFVVAAIGVEMCVLAGIATLVLLFFRNVPLLVKNLFSLLVLAAVYGVIVIRQTGGA